MAKTYMDALDEMLDESRRQDLVTLFEKIIIACTSKDMRRFPNGDSRMALVVDGVRPFVERLRGQYGVEFE